MVVTENGVAGHQNGWLVVLVLPLNLQVGVVNAKSSFHNEDHLVHLVVGADEAGAAGLGHLHSARVEIDDGLVDETSIARVEEVAEVLLEVFENQIDDLGLLLWRELLVEVEFFDNEVVIILKSLLNGLADRQVEVARDVERADR